MKRFILFVVAAMLMLPSQAQSQEQENYVQVYGYAQTELTPNEFTLSITIKERDSKGKVSVQEDERKMRAALKGAGIDIESALRLADNSSSYFKRGESLLTTQYELKLNSSEQLAAAFKALDPLALSSVKLIRATRSDIEQWQSKLRIEAMKNAAKVADELAEAVGQKRGVCLTIIDYNRGGDFGMERKATTMRSNYSEYAEESDEAQPLEFTTYKLTYSVQAKFELLP